MTWDAHTFFNRAVPAWDGGDRNVNGKTRALNIDVTTCGESAIEDEYRGHKTAKRVCL